MIKNTEKMPKNCKNHIFCDIQDFSPFLPNTTGTWYIMHYSIIAGKGREDISFFYEYVGSFPTYCR